MHAKNLFINKGGNRQAIKAISKYFPHTDIKSSFTLVIKPINTIDFCIFMVASQQENFIRVSYFVCKKQTNSLQALLATVNIISKEKIICRWGVATIFKKPQKVLILPMYITYGKALTLDMLKNTRLWHMREAKQTSCDVNIIA